MVNFQIKQFFPIVLSRREFSANFRPVWGRGLSQMSMLPHLLPQMGKGSIMSKNLSTWSMDNPSSLIKIGHDDFLLFVKFAHFCQSA